MGANIKNLRTRIKSVDSTLHLTKAMGLVASGKIRRATDAMLCGRQYKRSVDAVIANLASSPECKGNTFIKGNTAAANSHLIIVIAGDRGLCGGYNANIFRFMRAYPTARIIPIGKRACDRFGNRDYPTSEKFTSEEGYALASRLCEEYLENGFAMLSIVSTKYISVLTQEAGIKQILPIVNSEDVSAGGMLFEPNEEKILDIVVKEYVAAAIMAAVRESFASEAAARRTAMDSAGKNAEEMIDKLTISYNRARQSTITQEITEIVAGSGT